MSRKRPSHNIIDSRHPNYLSCMSDWEKWRLTYRGGDEFRDRFLEQFSAREERSDFNSRKAVTPIPAFAKAAVHSLRKAPPTAPVFATRRRAGRRLPLPVR